MRREAHVRDLVEREYFHIAAAAGGPAWDSAGRQTSFNDCAVFALANAARLPYGVVAARATGVDECIEDGVSGVLVPADDAAAMAAALTRYVVEPAARAAAASAAAKFARTAFAPAERARDYLALFARLHEAKA